MKKLVGIFLITVVMFLSLVTVLSAQEKFPARPIHIIVPMAPGGTTDRSIRGLTAVAAKYVDQAVVVENIIGGGGATGLLQCVKAKPDGYTLACDDLTLVNLPIFIRGIPFTYKDFKPVGAFMNMGVWLLTGTGRKWKNLEEFVEEAKKRPGEITVGVPAIRSPQEMMLRVLAENKQIKLNIIPFEGGAPTIASLLGGKIDAAMVGIPMGLENILAGDFRLLVAASPTKLARYPGHIPYFKEKGIPYEFTMRKGVFAPRETPKEIIEQLASIFEKMAKDPKHIEFCNKWGVEAEWVGPEEHERYIEEMHKMFSELKKEFFKE